MRQIKIFTTLWAVVLCFQLNAQQKLNPTVENFEKETYATNGLEQLAHELLDQIGPRLVGSPQMDRAHDWAIQKFESWGIPAENQKFGEWKAWERGISHIDMVSPYIKSLNATQLAWSPATKKPLTAEIIAMPVFQSIAEFHAWTPKVKGKIVLISPKQDYGRSDYQYKEFGTETSLKKITEEKKSNAQAWKNSLELIGYNANTLPAYLEDQGAAAIAISNWTGIMGANRIFGAKTRKIPMIDISNEEYSQLYRLSENGKTPQLRLDIQSKFKGNTEVYNTVAIIEGKEKPNEYVILSAHIDSWDGGQGATDNATGVITAMEAARLIKKFYPNNKRSILVCLWGSEEQGLNGSRAFVEDHPEILQNTQAVFNFDSGTGRITRINGGGFEQSYDFLSRWINAAPEYITKEIETTFPGWPSSGGSDHAAFLAHGIPAFMMGSLNWGYFGYTWHTNLDTYDKIVFDDLRYNTILAATMVYMASEEPEKVNRTKRIMPLNKEGNPVEWPEPVKANRNSDYYFVK